MPLKGARPAPWDLALVLVIAAALVGLRSFVFVYYEQAHFDADQAITGLMAKHLAEGRAFPVFQYLHGYVLAIEAWLAAPLFWLVGPSVTTLKLVPLGMNVVAAVLLVSTLCTSTGLRPASALLASLFFVVPPPFTSARLTEAVGMNIEPFVWVLLLWRTRQRPLAFGSILAIGFLNREFTLYGLSALLVIEACNRSLFTRPMLRAKAVSLLSFVGMWEVVQTLKQYSSPLGPGTSLHAGIATSNVAVSLGAYCTEPWRVLGNLPSLVFDYLPVFFGATSLSLRAVPFVNSSVVEGLDGMWGVFGAVVLLASLRMLYLRYRGHHHVPQQAVLFCWYLMIVGLQAAIIYGLARCNGYGLGTMRYALLFVLVPVGFVALYLRVEPSRVLKSGMLTLVIAWACVSLSAHERLIDEYLQHPPPANHRALADYLVSHGIRYGRADYWTAYHVTFLAQEQVKLTADYMRIAEYQRLFEANGREAARIRRSRSDRPLRRQPQPETRRWPRCQERVAIWVVNLPCRTIDGGDQVPGGAQDPLGPTIARGQ